MYGSVSNVKTKSGIDAASDIGLSSDSDLTTFIETLLTQASKYIERYTGRSFETHSDVTEKHDGTGYETLRLQNYPVISVSSITVNGNELSSDDYRIEKNTSDPNRNAGVLRRLDGYVFPKGNMNIEVTYSWGFSSVPEDISAIAESIAVDQLKNVQNNFKTGGLSSMSVGEYSMSFEGESPLTDSQKLRLEKWRKGIIA